MKTKAKTGRKQKHFVDPETGKPIVGLSRRPSDGRWRIIGTQITFSEPDVSKAIAKFKELSGQTKYTGMDPQEVEWLQTPAKMIVDTNMVTAMSRGFVLMGKPDEAWKKFWAYVANEIITKPKLIAEKTGIEKLGYLTDLKPPEKLPTFKELEKLWQDNAPTKPNERRMVLADWRYFVLHSGAAELSDITPELCIAYRNKVYKLTYGGKRQQHLFNRSRRMLTFAQSQAVAMEACAKALLAMRLLKPNETTVSIDPQPIEPADFKALLGKAEGDDVAFMLLMLNAALHTQECCDLTWDDIKGDTLIAHRKKKGKFLRIATLWQETLDALAKVKRKGDRIFYANTGAPITVSGVGQRFRKLRTKAEVPHVEADQIRDGAATAAGASENVNQQIFNLLMGHRNPGVMDHYAKRNPAMVKPACDAVYKHYFK